jgi:predicted RNA-binding protein associated with RNAse of E/G family
MIEEFSMKRKYLDRDLKWGFDKFPYYQMRVDTEEFHGLVCLIQLIDGQYFYWDLPKAGKVPVCGKGMTWLQLIPDGKHHVITAKYLPNKKVFQGVEYSNSIVLWYVDVIENIEYDMDGVAAFVDKYLDVYFTPQGDVVIDDRDELDAAYQSGELSKEQYEAALGECDLIIDELCTNVVATEIFCSNILSYVNNRIDQGEKQFKV